METGAFDVLSCSLEMTHGGNVMGEQRSALAVKLGQGGFNLQAGARVRLGARVMNTALLWSEVAWADELLTIAGATELRLTPGEVARILYDANIPDYLSLCANESATEPTADDVVAKASSSGDTKLHHQC